MTTKPNQSFKEAIEKRINSIKQSNPDLKQIEPIKKVGMPTVDTILTDSVSQFEPLKQLNELSYLMSLGVCGLTRPVEKSTTPTDVGDGEEKEDVGENHPEFILLYKFVDYMKKPPDVNKSLTSMNQ